MSRRPPFPGYRQRGTALILVLWLIVLLTALVGGFALAARTEHLQAVLTEYTSALSGSLDQRMEQIGTTIASRTGDLQVVFEEYTRALDSTLAGRSELLDQQFETQIEALDATIADRTQQLLDRSEALDVDQHLRLSAAFAQ